MTSRLLQVKKLMWSQVRNTWSENWHLPLMNMLQKKYDLNPKVMQHKAIISTLKKLKRDQAIDEDEYNQFGSELLAARSILDINGKVLLHGSNEWILPSKYSENYDGLPNAQSEDLRIEGIDASNSLIVYESFTLLSQLSGLRYLNLSSCKHVDNWCLERLRSQQNTLRYLNLSKCTNINDGCISILANFKNLKRLILSDMPKIKEKQLLALHLEECLPGCFVEGIDYTDTTLNINKDLYSSFRDNEWIAKLEKSPNISVQLDEDSTVRLRKKYLGKE